MWHEGHKVRLKEDTALPMTLSNYTTDMQMPLFCPGGLTLTYVVQGAWPWRPGTAAGSGCALPCAWLQGPHAPWE
jgi:hypothetical protein